MLRECDNGARKSTPNRKFKAGQSTTIFPQQLESLMEPVMSVAFPDYLSIPPDKLGEGTTVRVTICGDMQDVAQHMALAIYDEILHAQQENRQATLILPVGPVDQYPVLAEMINTNRLNCQEVMLINMDEYLTPEDQWVECDHPLSFRGFMNRKFYDLVNPELAPLPENRVVPNPQSPTAIQQLIEERNGVDACFGGIGINGHIAFNEPPEADEHFSVEEFAALPTRVLNLTRETKTINSVTVGGEMSIIPHRAVTVGMREILAAKRLRFYCNRIWQSSVVRKVLHGPVSASCPASLLRTHDDATLTVTDYVAELPDIRLR